MNNQLFEEYPELVSVSDLMSMLGDRQSPCLQAYHR